MAQIPAAISLLSALSGPFNPLQDMMTSGVDVQGLLLFLFAIQHSRISICTFTLAVKNWSFMAHA